MKHESGFSIIFIVIATTAILVLGLIGWRVWENRSSQSSTSDTANEATQELETLSKNGYLVIEEWGVKFKPVEGLNGVIYAKAAVQELYNVEIPEKTENVIFTTNDLANRSPNCRLGVEGFTPLGTLYRTPEKMVGAEPLLLKQIGEFFYYYRGPQAVCSNQGDEPLEQEALTKLQASLQNMEAKQ